MARNIEFDFKKISVKQAQKLIHAFGGQESIDFKNTYHNTAYVLSDNRAILHFDTHAFVYNSIDEIKRYINYLEAKRNGQFPTHILKDKLLYSESFEQHETELVNGAIAKFNLTNSTPSLQGVLEIEKFINKHKRINVDATFFSEVLAYVGRV